MGHFGRITAISDLPGDKVLARLIQRAVRLNETGVRKLAQPRPKGKKEIVAPGDLMAALKKNKRALATFERFSYSHRKEYIEWIAEAKRNETRRRRLDTTIQWLTEGKPRNWKYLGC